MEKPAREETILEQLTKVRQELSTLFEISNAMHKTLELEQILFVILTGVTSHTGLGFNRAMLLLLDSQGKCLEGKMGIGPDNGEEAKRIWSLIDDQKMDLDDLVNSYSLSKQVLNNSRFFNQVKNFKISVKEPDGGILAKAFGDGMPFHIRRESYGTFPGDPLISIFNSDEFVVVPLKAKDRAIGLIVADNVFTRHPITKDDIRILLTFANQAGMAIENSQLYEKAVVRAHKDSLTDLWNHGYFQYFFEEKLKQAKDHVSYMSIIMVDIDNFKNYNDTWGHQKGDDILSKISRIIADSSRKIDCVCRYGGEEFAIILPDATKKDAVVIAERIRANIEQHSFISESGHPHQNLTVSLGVASFPEDGTNKDELIRAADSALYEAKRAGKNKVCTAYLK
ncbi:MAG: sensor domain-containing diguanylate cyclase [Candidatus Omnitrophica bacterium]|nr:sensor domain-containing diguanylate cyclase [Candidatus Omnitrophota bacterium]